MHIDKVATELIRPHGASVGDVGGDLFVSGRWHVSTSVSPW